MTDESSAARREIAGKRFAAQLLAGKPASTPERVAARLLAIQGQDGRGARLAIRARTSGLTAADVDRALTADRTLVLTWLNRGTLHLVRTEDYWWLHQLTMRPSQQVAVRRMLAQNGVDDAGAEKGVSVVEAALLAQGPLTGPQLRAIVAAAGLPAQGNVPLHIVALASMRGVVVRGPMIGLQHAYVHARDWLGTPPPAPEPDVTLAELARRYLAGHGPASDRDLAKWAGLPLGEARRGLAAIASDLRDRPDGLAELETAAETRPADGPGGPAGPAPRLLGAYDPVLLGWASREEILGDHQDIVTVNGLFRPFALVDGRAAGIWSWSGGQVVLNRSAGLSPAAESALAAEARDVRRFLTGGVATRQPAGAQPADAGDPADPADLTEPAEPR